MFVFKALPSENNRGSTVIVKSNEVVLTDLLEDFEDFLRGCGFVFDGHLEIVEESIMEDTEDGS